MRFSFEYFLLKLAIMSEKVEHTHSDRSPSDDETRVGGNKAFGTMANLPPDPDEGLSDAEKAKIVSLDLAMVFGCGWDRAC